MTVSESPRPRRALATLEDNVKRKSRKYLSLRLFKLAGASGIEPPSTTMSRWRPIADNSRARSLLILLTRRKRVLWPRSGRRAMCRQKIEIKKYRSYKGPLA